MSLFGTAQPVETDRRPAPHRLRELRGHERLFAVAVLVLVLVPFAIALARAFHDGWVPSGDEANIATRSLDVFSRHPPLTGLPSTSYQYGNNIWTNHPGPIEFYLIAVPLRVLGASVGPLLTAAVINAALALIVVWVFFRRLGSTALLGAGFLMLAVMWSGGSALLVDTLSSNMTTYSLLCSAVLAWALVDGDVRLLPLGVLVASYAAEQHLQAGPIEIILSVTVGVALVGQWRRARRAGADEAETMRRWLLIAFAVAAVCWLPVFVDEIRGHPGNLTRIVELARARSQPNLGFVAGVWQLFHALAPPTILGRTDTSGTFFLHHRGASWLALGLVAITALVVIAWKARPMSRSVASLAFVALVMLVAGVLDGANVPATTERYRVNEYRWTWSAAFMTCAALGAGAALLVRRRGTPQFSRAARRIAPPALLVACALVTVAIVVVQGPDDHNRSLREFAVEKRVTAAVLAHIDRHRPVVVVPSTLDAHTSIAPAVIFRLVQAGVRVEVPRVQTSTYGPARRFRPKSDPAALFIASGPVDAPVSDIGTLLTTQLYSPERTALLDQLTAAATGKKVELAPGGKAVIDHEFHGIARKYVNAMFAFLPSRTRSILADPTFLRLVDEGVLRTPHLDKTKIDRLLKLPPMTSKTLYGYSSLYGEEQVRVYYLTPAQLRAHPIFGL